MLWLKKLFKKNRINYLSNLNDVVYVPHESIDASIDALSKPHDIRSVELFKVYLSDYISVDGILLTNLEEKFAKLEKLTKEAKHTSIDNMRRKIILNKTIESIENILKIVIE
jgi:hypothetical protein